MTNNHLALAPQNGLQEQSLTKSAALIEAENDIKPVDPDLIPVILATNLALCAPVGLDDDARMEWFSAAEDALGEIPEDLLRAAAKRAAKKSRHPAQIVPDIWDDVETLFKLRHKIYDGIKKPPAIIRPVETVESVENKREISSMIGNLTAELTRKAERQRT